MGAWAPFSKDSRDTSCENTVYVGDEVTVVDENTIRYDGDTWVRVSATTPDATKFVVLKKKVVNGYPVFIVQYANVTNYEGRKILMYPKHFDTNAISRRMDPHFFDRGDSPIARFEPTARGWLMAETLAKNLP